MPGYSDRMRAFRPPEAGMPFGIALAWAVVDLQLAFWLRVTQLALEVPREWCVTFAPLSTLERVRTTMTETEPQEGDLRVYHIQNPPREGVRYDVSNPGEGYGKIEALAAKDLCNPDIWGNVFGMEVFEDGEWVDWYDAEGDDIDAWAEKEGLDA